MKIEPLPLWLPALLLLPAVHAGDAVPSTFTFNAFGTLGATHSNEDRADFRTSLQQLDGAGYSHEWAFDVDSRLGLQLTADFTEQLTAVVQVVVEQNHDSDFDPELEWANLKYEFTPDFSMRIGRIVLPTLTVSDFRKVGYANPWVRPPLEVYSLVPVTNSDGIDASYRFHTGDVTTTIQATYGEKDFDIAKGGTFKSRDMFSAAVTTEFGATTLRAAYLHGRLTAPFINESLFDLFRLFGPPGDMIADRYSLDDTVATFATVGGSYDPGNWFIRAEWAETSFHSFRADNRGWYVSGGYRFDDFTPYATFGRRTKHSTSRDAGLDPAILPPEFQGTAVALNAGLNSLLDSNAFDSVAIGSRWDFRPDFSLKLQLDHIRLDEGSYGDLINAQPDFEPGNDLTVLSLTVDFVF